jgi:hypothetical protein
MNKESLHESTEKQGSVYPCPVVGSDERRQEHQQRV